jgi:flagellin
LGISFKTTSSFDADTSGAAIATAGLTITAGGDAAFQIGYEKDPNSILTVTLGDITAGTLGVASGDLATAGDAYNALATIDDAIDTLTESRAGIGAYQNRLGYASGNLAITLENMTAAESVIRDVDMASEMTTFTKNQILVQAGTAMLAQANQAPQSILSLLK